MKHGVNILGIKADVCESFAERARGLIGRPAPAPGCGLLIPRCNAIHTFFMRYPIDAIFLDAENRPVRTVRGIRPWRFFIWGGFRARAVLETAVRGKSAADESRAAPPPKTGSRLFGWLAAAGLLAVSAAFALAIVSFRASVARAAADALAARAAALAPALTDALRTEDFAAIHRLGDECRAADERLTLRSRGGGILYANFGRAAADEAMIATEISADGFRFRLESPAARAHAAYRNALPAVILASLVGVAGMLFVFFGFYRQRVQLRVTRRHLAEISELEKSRREFIADFSHELKTPLTGILGAAEMLADATGGDGDDANKANITRLSEMIIRESRRLNALAQQILDLSRLSAGAMATREELVDRAIEQLKENARRHSGSDEITVSESERDGFHCWIVEDHGVGIPEAMRERVFERFFRIDPARSRESGGAGLGLAIVRETARRLGGDCLCEAVEPHGARFIFKIPQ